MSPLTSPTDQFWKDAAALVADVERTVRSGSATSNWQDPLVSRFHALSGAQSVAIVVHRDDQQFTLARSGIAIGTASVADDRRLVVDRQLLPDTALSFDLTFFEFPSLAIAEPLRELAESLLDLCGGLYLRTQVIGLSQRVEERSDRDRWIGRLSDGASLRESFASIAAAIAESAAVERVSLLRRLPGKVRLIATSNQPRVDRRARLVRVLEQAVATIPVDHCVTYDLADPTAEFVSSEKKVSDPVPAAIRNYVDHSGCQQFRCQVWNDCVVVLERFSTDHDQPPLPLVLDSIGPPVRTAIGQAIARDNRHWLTIDHLRSEFGTMHMLFAGITAATVLLAAMLLPAELEIPVTGVISAANSSAIYAPAEGVVEEVLVDDGQQVSLGTPLIRLRSPELDLAQRTLEAALATAAVRLDSIQISRIGHSTRDEFSQTSLDERVLKTEIEGLQSQLALLQRQQQELLIHSPLNGRVDGWKLRSTWLARPVAVGQYLLSVLSPTEGWNVELEIPDRHVGYLLEHQRQRKCTVVFRLRSDAAVLHQGEIETIADTAQIDARGNSMVLATLPFAAAEPGQLRDGASVLAQVHCGQRSIGFVWLRGVVEWWRSSTWF